MSIGSSEQALARLEPYLLLAKSTRGAAAAKLIADVTGAAGCFVFAELLDVDGIQALADDAQHGKSFRLLELFAYGTYRDYRIAPSGTYPTLDEAQLDKLRQLTLVTSASKRRSLSYQSLIDELGLEEEGQSSSSSLAGPSRTLHARSIRALEDVIINAIYAGIISARLDQSRARVEVESVMGRDVRRDADDVDRMAKALQEWQSTTSNMLALLQERIRNAQEKDAEKGRRRDLFDENVERKLIQLANSSATASNHTGTAPRGSTPYDRLGSDRLSGEMDTDEDGMALRKKKSTSGGPMRSKRTRA